MKQATITSTTRLIILGLFIFTGCSSSIATTPSKNNALNNITNVNKEYKSYSMQKSLDNWLKEKWTPTIEKNATIHQINQDKQRDFTLQEYVDKIEVYLKESNSTTQEPHWQKVNTLPVIGK